MLFMSWVCHAFAASVHCNSVVTSWERAPTSWLLFVISNCDSFHFFMWYPGSGEVLNCIDS